MHESQIKWMLEHDEIDFLDMVRTCSRYSDISGADYAEDSDRIMFINDIVPKITTIMF